MPAATSASSETLEPYPVGHLSRYTVPCRECGGRLRLNDDDELGASLSEQPLCWVCDQSMR